MGTTHYLMSAFQSPVPYQITGKGIGKVKGQDRKYVRLYRSRKNTQGCIQIIIQSLKMQPFKKYKNYFQLIASQEQNQKQMARQIGATSYHGPPLNYMITIEKRS